MRMRLLAIASGAVVVACARDGSSPERRIAWDAPAPVSTEQGGAAPVFALGPAGRLSVAWVSAPNRGTDGRLYVRSNVRSAAVTELRDSLGSLSIYGEVPPKIAYGPDGVLYAAYLVTKAVPGQKWPKNALRFASSPDGGATWRAPMTVTTTAAGDSVFGSYDDHALHAAPDGSLYISWLALTGDTSHTYFIRSSDKGATWSRPAKVDAGASCPCCRTSLTSAPDGSLYVAWRKIYPGGAGKDEIRDIAIARSADHGQTWSAPTRVHADDWHVTYCPDAGPSVKVGPNGAVHIAWWSGKEGAAGVRYAQSSDNGATFASPVELGVAKYSRAAHVQLALGSGADSGVVVAVWDDGTRSTPQIVARTSHDGGRTFGVADVLSDAGKNAGYPVVGLRGDTVTVAWQERGVAAAAQDSAEHAHMDPNKGSTYINAVGALQVVGRTGTLRR